MSTRELAKSARVRPERHPHLEGKEDHGATESLLRNAYDGERITIQSDFRADRAGAAAELSLPQAITDNGYRVVVFREQPPRSGPHSQQAEVIACHQVADQPLGRSGVEAERNTGVRCKSSQGVIPGTVIPVIGVPHVVKRLAILKTIQRNQPERFPDAGQRS